MSTNKKDKTSIENKSKKLNEYLEIKKEHKAIKEEETNLKNYIDTNIFDYVENKEDVENIFEIKNPTLRFINQIRNSEIINSNVPVLEINNLTKYYGSKNLPTLVNLSIKVYLGDFHVVVGNYSSGKTTLLKCLQGSEQYEGEILIDGSISKNNFEQINQIFGFVTEHHNWDPFLTVEEIIFNKFQELKLSENYAKKYIRNSLQQFDLNEIRNTAIIDLSLLEIKKVQLIIALINDPHLIVFDQPLIGLQYFEKVDFLVLLAKLRQKARSILVFSHEIEEFTKYANTMTILVKGKVYYSGLIQNLLFSQINKFLVVTQNNEIALEILNSLGCKTNLNTLKNVIYVTFDGHLNILEFQKRCSEKNLLIHEFSPISINIEDLYPKLLNIGTKDAIVEINKLSFFSPD